MGIGKGYWTGGKSYSDSSRFHSSSKLQEREKVGIKIEEEEPPRVRS
jgi:hypothetical protein